MLYPVNSRLDDMYYEKVNDSYEALHFGESKESSEVPFYVRSTYNQGKDTNDIELYLTLLSDSIDYDGEYEEIELDDKVIYFARKSEKVNSKVNNAFYFRSEERRVGKECRLWWGEER